MLTKQQYQDVSKKLHAIANTSPNEVWWTLCIGFQSDECTNTQAWFEARDQHGTRLDNESSRIENTVGETFMPPGALTGSLGQAVCVAVQDLLEQIERIYKKNCVPETVVVNGHTYKLVK